MACLPRPIPSCPRPVFKNIWEVEHTKRLMLGLPVVLRGYMVPVGYDRHPEKHWLAVPNKELFKNLIKARNYLEDGYSLTKVVRWYQAVTGTKTNISSMLRIMRDRYPQDAILELSEDERERRFAGPIDYWAEASALRTKNISRRKLEKDSRSANQEEERAPEAREENGEGCQRSC